MHLKSIFLSIFLSCCLFACTTASGPSYTDAPKAKASDEYATVHFYRTGAGNQFYGNTRLFINKKKVITIKENGYTWVKLKPGKYKFEENVRWDLRELWVKYVPTKMQATIDANKIYYVAIDIGREVIKEGHMGVEMVGDIPVPAMVGGKVDYPIKMYFDKTETGKSKVQGKIFQSNNFK